MGSSARHGCAQLASPELGWDNSGYHALAGRAADAETLPGVAPLARRSSFVVVVAQRIAVGDIPAAVEGMAVAGSFAVGDNPAAVVAVDSPVVEDIPVAAEDIGYSLGSRE